MLVIILSVLVAHRFGRRTFDQAVFGVIPGRGVMNAVGQLSLPSILVGKPSTSLTGWG